MGCALSFFSRKSASGKNIDGRPQFKEIMRRIETDAENAGYVPVSNLFRFLAQHGRYRESHRRYEGM